jgi:hypothetical protein
MSTNLRLLTVAMVSARRLAEALVARLRAAGLSN